MSIKIIKTAVPNVCACMLIILSTLQTLSVVKLCQLFSYSATNFIVQKTPEREMYFSRYKLELTMYTILVK